MSLKISHKIYLLAAMLILAITSISISAIYGFQKYGEAVEKMEIASRQSIIAKDLNSLVLSVVMDSRGIYMAQDAVEVKKYADPLEKNLEKIRQTLSSWEELANQNNVTEFDNVKIKVEEFVKVRTELARLGKDMGAQAARQYGDNDQNRANRKELNEAITKVANILAKDVKDTASYANQFDNDLIKLITILSGAFILFSIVLSYIISKKQIINPLNFLIQYLSELTKGNLDQIVPYQEKKDEIGIMALSIKLLREKLLKEREYAEKEKAQRIIDADYRGQISAISKSQAVIEFDVEGNILSANENFLKVMNYTSDEIIGRHHSMFISEEEINTDAYRNFWKELSNGIFQSAEYKRIGKDEKEVWIRATYNPIYDPDGKVFKVVKYAIDVTHEKMRIADFEGQIIAINKAQAVIHFDMNGIIQYANKSFLDLMGYTEDEIVGRHHKMFVEEEEASGKEYEAFWSNLRNGKFDARVFKRKTKFNKYVWIQASYNPIFDLNEKAFKVVKYATDVTEIVNLTDQTGHNVQSVAAATEELSASISEIAQSMDKSRKAAEDIVTKTQKSDEASKNLTSTMEQMESIIGLIRDIAEQVNLLALNATIEAARAGEAGKGFAVVASEVKNLATQTAKATDDIAQEISNLQGISDDVAQAVRDIVEAAVSVNDYISGVAAAVEEQSVIVRDISSNSQITSSAVLSISENIKKKSA